jgi:hypothetical protein
MPGEPSSLSPRLQAAPHKPPSDRPKWPEGGNRGAQQLDCASDLRGANLARWTRAWQRRS